MKFRDIPQFTQRAPYRVNQSWRDIETWLGHYCNERMAPLDLDPDYQRGHVWTEKQQIAFVEFGLRGGQSGMDILTNCPGWMGSYKGPFELVDGKQRITAVRRFIGNEIPAFGLLYREFEDRLSPMEPSFYFNVNTLKTRKEVLTWYLEINSGGVVHTQEELARVRALLEEELK